jgi:proteasome lid subunit RPN8/RPN11
MITLPQPIAEAIHTHAERAYPYECCGVLLGTCSTGRWQVAAVIAAANAEEQSPRNRYRIAPKNLASILRDAHLCGLEIAGFYHSHPDHPPQWSQTDLAEAHWLGCLYLITEVRCGKAATTCAFLLAGTTEEEKHFLPIPLTIEPPL